MTSQPKFRFDAEYYYNKATDLREQTSREDWETWRHNPLTQALLLDIDGNMAQACLNWANGTYVTTEEEAKARGSVATLDLVGQLVHSHPYEEAAA